MLTFIGCALSRPSFNGVGADDAYQERAIINTMLSLLSS
jgi:hypothetical protein